MSPQDKLQIEKYLDRLCAQLTKLPMEKQDEVRRETRAHLEAMIEAKVSVGITPAEAVETALTQFGNPVKIGRQIASEWRNEIILANETKWIVRICFAPILFISVWMLLALFFINVRRPVIDSDKDWLLLTLYVVFCAMWVLWAWRAYEMKRWACIMFLACGYYYLYDSAAWYLRMQSGYDPGFPSGIALFIASIGTLTSMFALRWRHLKPGI